MTARSDKGGYAGQLTKRRTEDHRLILVFYSILIISLLLSAIDTLEAGWRGFAFPLFTLVQYLMYSFFVIGAVVFLLRFSRGHIRTLWTVVGVGAVCLLVSLAAVQLDSMGYPISLYFQPSQNDLLALNLWDAFISVTLNFIWAYLICFGVIGVSCALLRRNIPRLLCYVQSMDVTVKSWRNRMVIGAFSLPTIVDFHKIEVGPIDGHRTFPLKQVRKNLLLILYFAILIPSYVLLNPLFLQQAETTEVISFAIGASLFIPVIVLPFSSMIDSKARAINKGRDFDLGRGFRRTVMNFTGLGTLLLLFLITTQMKSVQDIAAMYALYMFVAVAVAMIFIYVYYNYFQNDLIHDIVEQFNERCGRN